MYIYIYIYIYIYQQKENYGFRSRKGPPAVEELAEFEEDLRLMIKIIKFKKINNEF